MEEATIILNPVLQIRASRAAEVLGVSLEKANRILGQPDTRQILIAALNQTFNETIDRTLKEMCRVPTEIVPIRRDCCVKLKPLPEFKAGFGL